jgi:hypothetical protein
MDSSLIRRAGLFALLAVAPCSAQLTPDDKVFDLLNISATFRVNYAAADLKNQEFGVDLFNLSPWLTLVQQTPDDVSYLDVLTQYVAQLKDSHVSIRRPFDFQAYLGFSADLYDGKVIIDNISPSLVPSRTYPFQTGDELVSVDGIAVADWIATLKAFGFGSSPRSATRSAIALLTLRPQTVIGNTRISSNTAQVVIRRSSGAIETYTMPWYKTGTPVTTLRPCGTGTAGGVGGYTADPTKISAQVPDERAASIANMGSQTPLFLVPPTFVARLGVWSAFTGVNSPYFFSGVWTANNLRIGYIRIPSFAPADTGAALAQFRQEVQALRGITDGLAIDVMHNPGGYVQYAETLAQSFMSGPFQTMGFEIRPSLSWIQYFSTELQSAIVQNASATVIGNLQDELSQVKTAYNAGTARTGPLSLNPSGSLWLDGSAAPYDKPLVILTDEFTASAAEMFSAVMQDNGRAKVIGISTMGAGGTVQDLDAGVCTEGTLSLTTSLMHRSSQVTPVGGAPTYYVENTGVLPDVTVDYMTVANLFQYGGPFVNQITTAIVQQIQGH